MNCNIYREQLSEHLDGKLLPAQAQALESHLATCPACRAELDALRKTVTLVQALPHAAAPADTLTAVRSRIGARPRARILHLFFQPAARAALVAAIVLIIFTYGYHELATPSASDTVMPAPTKTTKYKERQLRYSETLKKTASRSSQDGKLTVPRSMPAPVVADHAIGVVRKTASQPAHKTSRPLAMEAEEDAPVMVSGKKDDMLRADSSISSKKLIAAQTVSMPEPAASPPSESRLGASQPAGRENDRIWQKEMPADTFADVEGKMESRREITSNSHYDLAGDGRDGARPSRMGKKQLFSNPEGRPPCRPNCESSESTDADKSGTALSLENNLQEKSTADSPSAPAVSKPQTESKSLYAARAGKPRSSTSIISGGTADSTVDHEKITDLTIQITNPQAFQQVLARYSPLKNKAGDRSTAKPVVDYQFDIAPIDHDAFLRDLSRAARIIESHGWRPINSPDSETQPAGIIRIRLHIADSGNAGQK